MRPGGPSQSAACDDTLPLTRQARVLGISRGSVYYLPKPVSAIRFPKCQRERSPNGANSGLAIWPAT